MTIAMLSGTVIAVNATEKITTFTAVMTPGEEMFTVKAWQKDLGIAEGDTITAIGAMNLISTDMPGYKHMLEINADYISKGAPSAPLAQAEIFGNVGQDPKSSAIQIGNSYARLSVACKFMKETFWVNVLLWGKDAEFAQKYIRKGALVTVNGRLKWSEYKEMKSIELVGKIQTLRKGENSDQESYSPPAAKKSVVEEVIPF